MSLMVTLVTCEKLVDGLSEGFEVTLDREMEDEGDKDPGIELSTDGHNGDEELVEQVVEGVVN